ncbi:hypothetical protein HNY73_000305 [Argiope bruennichi]|uniref:Uncharacterized protein n=1 Tax=Argiope bruennichi TaxID=94029 RepID=A0A8T0FXN1_ARGBR|nr:hypothetical protein HNY73_000305 [Argiope bruennichi]
MPEKIKSLKELRSTREIHNEDLGKMFESAVHLLEDLKPDLLKLSSSLSRKRRVEKSNFFPLDRLPNCKDETNTRCHRTRHMKKKKHPHNAEKIKKYNLSKRKEKRRAVAVKAKAAHPRATALHRKRDNSTEKGYDYEDMIFTPKTYEDITATQPGLFDSIINFFARKQTTRNPMSTIEGFELSSEFQTSEPTERKGKMMEHDRKHLQAVQTPRVFHSNRKKVHRPGNRNRILQSEKGNQILYAAYTPQILESNRNQILQPQNRNKILQLENRKQIQRPENRNQLFQPEDRIQTPQMFQSNRNQILQPENRNQVFQPENRNQVLQPDNRNQIVQPENRNQVFQPENRNQVFQPENRNNCAT